MNLKNKTCAIAILARDCELSLKRNIPLVESIGDKFKDYCVYVVENNSVDHTVDLLNSWAENNRHVTVNSQDYSFFSNDRTGSGATRIERMAFVRNQYIDHFSNADEKYDYLVVLDIDVELIFPDAVEKAVVNAPADAVGILANGRFYTEIGNRLKWGKYYDNYAFLPKGSEYMDLTYEEVRLNNDYVQKNIANRKYLECDSAFGGIGIYDYKSAIKCRYSTIANKRSDYYTNVCEHILFHKEIRDYGKLYISSDLELGYQKQAPWFLLLRAPFSQATMLWVYKNILRRNMPQ